MDARRVVHHAKIVGLAAAVVVAGGILGMAAALFSMTRGDGPEFPY